MQIKVEVNGLVYDSHAKPEASVRAILLNGGKWPNLPH